MTWGTAPQSLACLYTQTQFHFVGTFTPAVHDGNGICGIPFGSEL